MNTPSRLLLTCSVTLLATSAAYAHVGVTVPGFANTTNETTFTVGHGCGTDDTYKIKIEIPKGVTGVRPLNSDFAKAVVEKDAMGNVTAVVWTKAGDVEPVDTHYYKFSLRARLPDAPFTRLYFLTYQYCRNASGTESMNAWVGTSPPTGSGSGADGGAPDAAAVDAAAPPEPAPVVPIVPARVPGWNKYMVKDAIDDPSVYFKDALIVWAGNAAYSANPNTKSLIEKEPGTTLLTRIAPGTEIWVKY